MENSKIKNNSKLIIKIKWLANTPVLRIIVGFALCMVIMLMFKQLLFNLFLEPGVDTETPSWQFLLRGAANIGLYWLIYRFWEKRKVSEISLKKIHFNGLLSLLFGFLLISFVLFVFWISGNFIIVSSTGGSMLLALFIHLLSASIFEEVLLRGIIFRITENSLNTVWAIIISSIIFSALHLSNGGFNIVSFISLMGLGALLGIIYSLTKILWSVIFVHLGWNFAQGFFGLKYIRKTG